jgi:hypothetical protein
MEGNSSHPSWRFLKSPPRTTLCLPTPPRLTGRRASSYHEVTEGSHRDLAQLMAKMGSHKNRNWSIILCASDPGLGFCVHLLNQGMGGLLDGWMDEWMGRWIDA